MDSNLPLLIVGVFYLLACIVVASVANERGWDGLTSFVVALIATPIIAAILYSPYKKEEQTSSDQ